MPLYEYRCPDCDHRFEVLQRVGEDAAGVACPECGSEKPVKQFSTFASTGGGPSAFGGGCSAPAGSGFT